MKMRNVNRGTRVGGEAPLFSGLRFTTRFRNQDEGGERGRGREVVNMYQRPSGPHSESGRDG